MTENQKQSRTRTHARATSLRRHGRHRGTHQPHSRGARSADNTRNNTASQRRRSNGKRTQRILLDLTRQCSEPRTLKTTAAGRRTPITRTGHVIIAQRKNKLTVPALHSPPFQGDTPFVVRLNRTRPGHILQNQGYPPQDS